MSELQMPPQMSEPDAQSSATTDGDSREEAFALMSMALDGLLDAQETERLEVLMKQEAGLRTTWQDWQKMDSLLTSAVHADPEAGFVLRFEKRLAVKEQRARSRRRVAYGAVAVVAWLLSLVALGFVGWLLVSNQSQWMNGFVRELVYYPSAVVIWVRALRATLSATVSEPQSIAMTFCYMAGAAVMLSTWLWFLRRTTREEIVS